MEKNFSPLLIGSFPHTDISKVSELIASALKEYPMWPQLPNRSFLESMYVQYSEGMPFTSIDENERKIFFSDPESDPEKLMEFMEAAESGDLERFRISREFSKGFHEFVGHPERLDRSSLQAVKGHTTGPFSFAFTVTDEKRNAAWFDPNLREIIRTGLKMKAIWQIEQLKKLSGSIVFFIDEPYLAGIGSGVMSINKDEAEENIYSFIEEIKEACGDIKTGIHCCGNTDWSIILESPADILSYDAYSYGKSLLLYKDQLKAFIRRGGCIAWGAVPTCKEIVSMNADDLLEKFIPLLKELEDMGISKEEIREHSFISPACGMGSLSEEAAEKILSLTSEISVRLRNSDL